VSTNLTVEGRVGSDPEVRFTASGKSVVTFSLVSSKNVKDSDGKWSESETTWWRVTCWEGLGENVSDSVSKGTDVIVVGRAYTDEWTDKEGNTRQSLALSAYNVGVALKRAKASAKKVERVKPAAPEADPWAITEAEPPF
jgi:single-strand DNA-binding protein